MACAPKASTNGFEGLESDLPSDPLNVLADSRVKLAEFVSSLRDADYNRKSEYAGGGTIGGHIRHCLDHVSLLLDGIGEGLVDYDRRQRGTDVERSPSQALQAIHRLEGLIGELSGDVIDREIRVRGQIQAGSPAMEVHSTTGRGLVFVISHTIHHQAVIAAAAREIGVSLLADFGFAPATIAYRKRTECVPSPLSR